MSSQRRLSYLTEMKRERVQESFGDDYAAFLRSCEMRTRVSCQARMRRSNGATRS
jgi:hypothetical protein